MWTLRRSRNISSVFLVCVCCCWWRGVGRCEGRGEGRRWRRRRKFPSLRRAGALSSARRSQGFLGPALGLACLFASSRERAAQRLGEGTEKIPRAKEEPAPATNKEHRTGGTSSRVQRRSSARALHCEGKNGSLAYALGKNTPPTLAK